MASAPIASSITPKIFYSKTRLTSKETWTLTWGAANAQNNTPVAGYRIRLFVDDNTVPIKNSSGTIISQDSGNGVSRHFYDTETPEISINFYAQLYSDLITANKKVYFTVNAYSKNEDGSKLFSDTKVSDTYVIYNAASVNIKTNESWREGQVWIKTLNGWREAESVYIKTADGWKESK